MPKCAWQDCHDSTKSNSKYCPIHAKEAKLAWKTIIKESKQKAEDRDKYLHQVFEKAYHVGMKAGNEHVPTPMVVVQHENQLDDSSKVQKSWAVASGVCGFAWIVINPANCSAANYAKKYLGARKSYPKGIAIWINEFGQSYEKKLAFAQAYANELCVNGINAQAYGRLD